MYRDEKSAPHTLRQARPVFIGECCCIGTKSAIRTTVRAIRWMRSRSGRVDRWRQLPLRRASGLLRINASTGNRPWQGGEDIHSKRLLEKFRKLGLVDNPG
jgi:hypothetical protein